MTAINRYVGILNPRKRKARRVLSAWQRGCGGRTIHSRDAMHVIEPDEIPVFYGVDEETLPIFQRYQRTGRYIYLDNGYFRSKYDAREGVPSFLRVTSGAAQVMGYGTSDGRRFARLDVEFAPWRTQGEHVLVAVQSEWWYRRRGLDRGQWITETVAELGRHTDRRIVVRQKPLRGQPAPPLDGDLAGAWCTVTLDSNVAIDGLIRGIPAIVLAPCAAQTMGSANLSDVEDPRMPADRLRWARVLADHQFSQSEIAKGVAVAAIENRTYEAHHDRTYRRPARATLRRRNV